MRKSQFIFVLMLGSSFATMARAADTSYANCVAAVGAANAANCVQIGTSGTYYALSGAANNQTMTIYGTTGEGSEAASVPGHAFIDSWSRSTLDSNIKSLKTSGSVNIGEYAFYYATGLTSVDLRGVQSIGKSAFNGGSGLTSVDLTGVQSIGDGAFTGTTSLTGHLDLTGVQSLGVNAFAQTGLTSVDLTGLQSIPSSAFQGATSLTSVNLTGVQEIGGGAFADTGLTSVDLTGVQTIRYYAFSGATGLTSVDLTGVQEIGQEAFSGATGLTSVVLPDSFFDEDGDFKADINKYAFDGSSVSTVYFPEGYCGKNTDCLGYFKNCSGFGKYGCIDESQMFSESNFKTYSVDANGQIKVGNRTYASLNDLANNNHIKKRIYTLKEANEVTGPVNRVSIKYR